jgi:hypothetical protein
MAQFKVLSRYLTRGVEENLGNSASEKSVTGPRFEHSISKI